MRTPSEEAAAVPIKVVDEYAEEVPMNTHSLGFAVVATMVLLASPATGPDRVPRQFPDWQIRPHIHAVL
jgi:hypothetical protein